MAKFDNALECYVVRTREEAMLVRLKSGNRLTLPKAVTAAVEAADYFDVTTENGRIVLTPFQTSRADGVHTKLAEGGLSESDVSDAVAWARSHGKREER